MVLLGLMLVGSVFGVAARIRLSAIGCPITRARQASFAVMAVALAVGLALVRPTADGIITLSLQQAGVMGGVFIAANVLFLIAVRLIPATGPPRRTQPVASSRVGIARRPLGKWFVPALIAGPGIFAFHLVQAGQWLGLALFSALTVYLAVEGAASELTYRRQRALADTGGGPAPVILLRSFVADRISGREFSIARAVRRRFGRFAALGNPHDETRPFGADRHYVGPGPWTVELTTMARDARAILMLPDVTPAIRWELGMIRDENLQTRFYVVQPRIHPITFWKSFYRRLAGVAEPASWADFAQALRDTGFRAVPEVAPSTGFALGFDGEGRCVEIASAVPSAVDLVERIAARASPTGDA